MHLDTAQFTAIGTRKTNEDALAWANEDELACFVLADGGTIYACDDHYEDLLRFFEHEKRIDN